MVSVVRAMATAVLATALFVASVVISWGVQLVVSQYDKASGESEYSAMFRAQEDVPPETITVERTKILETYIGNYEMVGCAVQGSDKIVYAYDIRSEWPKTGSEYKLSGNGGEIVDLGLVYILNHGFPNMKITGRNEIDQYITQLAIWAYLDEDDKISHLSSSLLSTDKEAYSGIKDEIVGMREEARWAAQNQEAIVGVGYRLPRLYVNPDIATDRIIVCSYPEDASSEMLS